MSGEVHHLGHGVSYRFVREFPSIDLVGLVYEHPHPSTGEQCTGSILFDTPAGRRVAVGRAVWTVDSWDPLTISPSLLCICGHHGFIRNGTWVPA